MINTTENINTTKDINMVELIVSTQRKIIISQEQPSNKVIHTLFRQATFTVISLDQLQERKLLETGEVCA